MFHSPISTASLPRLRPSEYLALRRKAAGLSVDEVATILAPAARNRAACRALVRLWETRGVAASADAVRELRRAFPLDIDVYRQLATEPVERHPRVCRACGCSEWDPCGNDHGTCAWADHGRCTACVGKAA